MIDFIKYQRLYFLLSAAVLIPGIISLSVWGLKPSIDFTGGTNLELTFEVTNNEQLTINNLKDVFMKGGIEITIAQDSEGGRFVIKMPPIGEEEKLKIKELLAEKFGEAVEVNFGIVGPTLGRELLIKTLVAVVLAAGFILAYVAWRFKDKMYGVCAILAMFHDTLILLGSFSLLGHFFGVEVDTLFVTAVLTILSFSVHDTVVVFDGIRESASSLPARQLGSGTANFEAVVNRAINETLIRSLNNSLTIIFMLLALVLLGGQTIRWFAVALLIGTVTGTYSSTFTAAPLLVVWNRIASKRSAGKSV